MAWLFLGIAALFEILFAISMKLSNGFTNLTATVATAVGVVLGIGFLTLAMKSLPVSVAYPIWTGLGTLGTVILGVMLFGEQIGLIKIAAVLAILSGVAVLKVTG